MYSIELNPNWRDPMAQARTAASAPQTPEPSTAEYSPERVPEESSHTYVQNRDPVGKAMAASTLIQTLVWSGVVIVLLVVGIMLLLHYHIL
jgi:hypothetical protein